MPLFACDHERIPGAVPFPKPSGGRAYDADGNILPLYLFRMNTDTGRIDRYDVRDGKWTMDLAGRCVVLSEQYPAPLTYVTGVQHVADDDVRGVIVEDVSDTQPPRMAT